MVTAGTAPERADKIRRKPAGHGLHSIGSVRALYLPDDWTPWIAPRLRLPSRALRQQDVRPTDDEDDDGLTDEEIALLHRAIETFMDG